MASITEKLQRAAPRNKKLLQILSETDHAPSALEQQKRYIQDLDVQIKDVKKRVSHLGQERSKEQKDHEKYRDSVMKRWAYKVSGNKEKFAAKAEKEEQEYFEVLQKLQQASALEENLKSMRAEASSEKEKIEVEYARHTSAKNELDSLYADIFQGPTPSFPEEDEAERQAARAAENYNSACAKLEADRQVQRLLEDAANHVRSSLSHIEEALDCSRMDMFGSSSADAMERTALHNAEMDLMQLQMITMQAQRFSPEVQSPPAVKISKGNLMSDVLFDNIFSDMEFHEKIKESRVEVQRCQQAVLAQLTAAKERVSASEQQTKVQSDLLNRAREELQKVRQGIFGRLADEQIHQTSAGRDANELGAPPPYA